MIRYRRELNQLLADPLTAVCVEIGVAEGYNAGQMLEWGIKTLHLVDAWRELKGGKGDIGFEQDWHDANLRACRDRLAVYGDKAVYHRMMSLEASRTFQDASVDLVYLDASHDEQSVWDDLIAWVPKVKKGGICAGHDFFSRAYGVQKAVNRFCQGRFKVEVIREDKDEDAGFYFIVE